MKENKMKENKMKENKMKENKMKENKMKENKIKENKMKQSKFISFCPLSEALSHTDTRIRNKPGESIFAKIKKQKI
ncbi:hypothetical protein C922_03615 [Plasmodium inui San Antonio 1]|uniref:Uncharacterized protein n=1 Tax=Plasmodium inui San Antonio 1 TaxID=1237626 RepID=W7AKM4_9APIC|nr:hypothetical protein C922_03615 [Plasmodium inui San Antonio 1]EUD65891.1 hypothetical protein C922_03615 [Plasmodium inui San Antonio 1]